ncbi:MAG: endonuclease/exonuclease/phosphatase family protein [Bacillota bacterium]
MTANLAGPRGYGFPKRELATRQIFSECRPHIVGFQEFAESNWQDLERPDLTLVPCEVFEAEYAGVKERMYGNPIAYDPTQFELLEYGVQWLHPHGKQEKAWDAIAPRSACWAHFHEKDSDRHLAVINTQMDNVGQQARAEGAAILIILANLATARLGPDVPTIIMGDANVNVGSPHLRWNSPELRKPYDLLYHQEFVDAITSVHPPRARPRTFHHYQGSTCGDDEWGTYDPDWIFVRNLEVENSTIITKDYGGVWPSDHYGS